MTGWQDAIAKKTPSGILRTLWFKTVLRSNYSEQLVYSSLRLRGTIMRVLTRVIESQMNAFALLQSKTREEAAPVFGDHLMLMPTELLYY